MTVWGVDVAGTVACMVKASLTARDVAWLTEARGVMAAGPAPSAPGTAHVIAKIDALLAP